MIPVISTSPFFPYTTLFRSRTACGQQRLLDAHRVHGVAVDEEDALGEELTRGPQGVGVVPLLGLVVVAEGDLDAMALLEGRSEEHTSELQSRGHLVCRLMLE